MLPLMKESTVSSVAGGLIPLLLLLLLLILPAEFGRCRQSLSRFRFCNGDGDGDGGAMGEKVRISVC